MGQFGAFSPFGLLTFGHEDSPAAAIYASMIGGVAGAIDTSAGSHADASIYARAIAIASARAAVRHGYDQRRPQRAVEGLAALEKGFGITPSVSDSPALRRRRLAARRLIPRGSSLSALSDALRTLLGADFVRVHAEGAEVSYPPDPEARGAWDAPAALPRYFRLTQSVVTVGSPLTFSYENLLADGERMGVRDVLSVQPENPTLAEAITITAAPSSGALLATATFLRAHDVGAIVRTHAPLWSSTQRILTVVVSATTASDPNVRRQIDELLRRLVRATTQWQIVQESSPGVLGPWTIGSSRIGTTTIGSTTL